MFYLRNGLFLGKLAKIKIEIFTSSYNKWKIGKIHYMLMNLNKLKNISHSSIREELQQFYGENILVGSVFSKNTTFAVINNF